jgi:hypothetical protein
MESNKIFNLLDKAIDILERCWKGYKPVAGVKPYEAGSCEKEMATQSDMSEIEEVIAMLDKAINFYDPTQARDESGRWAGGGGGASSDTQGNSYGDDAEEKVPSGNLGDEIQQRYDERLTNMKRGAVTQEHHNEILKTEIASKEVLPLAYEGIGGLQKIQDALMYESLKPKGQADSYKVKVLKWAEREIESIYKDNDVKGFEIIKKLDKLIEFYDPSQDRDESGKWSGSGGGGSSSEQVERSTDGMDSESAKQQKYADKKAKEIASDVPSFKAYKIEGSNIDEPVLRGISKSDSAKIASALKSKGWKSAGKNEGRETFKKSENEITVSKISGKDGTDVDVLPKIDISKAK